MKYEVAEDKLEPGDYRVEAINQSGDIFIAIFVGPDAQLRADEYAAWRNICENQPPPTRASSVKGI